jgi:hypothetical protein
VDKSHFVSDIANVSLRAVLNDSFDPKFFFQLAMNASMEKFKGGNHLGLRFQIGMLRISRVTLNCILEVLQFDMATESDGTLTEKTLLSFLLLLAPNVGENFSLLVADKNVGYGLKQFQIAFDFRLLMEVRFSAHLNETEHCGRDNSRPMIEIILREG